MMHVGPGGRMTPGGHADTSLRWEDSGGTVVVAAADFVALLAENQRLREDCPICGHKWRQHDPEDGRCDSHSSEGIGVCECGRDMAWMNGKIAALSREALAGDTEYPKRPLSEAGQQEDYGIDDV